MFCVHVCLVYVWFVCVLFVPSVLWYCWLGLLICKNRLPYNLYCVGGDIKHCSVQSRVHGSSQLHAAATNKWSLNGTIWHWQSYSTAGKATGGLVSCAQKLGLVLVVIFDPRYQFQRGGLDTKQLSNSKGHHPVGSSCRSSDGAEWSCVAGLEVRCAGRESCYPCRGQRQPRFSDRDRPEKSNPRCRMSPKMQGVEKCAFCPGPGITIINKGHFTTIINTSLQLC